MTVRNDYEVFTQNKITRNFTKDRAVHAADSPTVSQPFAIVSPLAASQLTGTIITFGAAADLKFVGDVGPGQVYNHKVRNVKTYSAQAEATFDEIDEGDPVYYDLDIDGTMPDDVRLSTSPLASDGSTANTRFGWIVLKTEDEVYPKGTTTASTQECGVLQIGAGGIV